MRDKSSSSSSILISTGNRLRTGFESHCRASYSTLLVINSSNGLLLLYSSMPALYYEVYNPTTGDKVSARFSFNYETFATRYMVFGFAFDPYSAHPYFTIIDIADTGARKVPSYVRDDYALSSRSTFCRGALHWLFEPSGVVSFDVRSKTISFFLINLPGNEKYLDDDGLCIYVKKMRDARLYSKDLPTTDASFAFLFNAVKQLQADPLAITEDTFAHPKANMFLARAKSIVRHLNDDGLIHLCNIVVKYNDFIRVEGCLYGCTAKHEDSSKVCIFFVVNAFPLPSHFRGNLVLDTWFMVRCEVIQRVRVWSSHTTRVRSCSPSDQQKLKLLPLELLGGIESISSALP
ncbi:hypothetical protein ACSBR2_041550 [Camellia fascicularis]